MNLLEPSQDRSPCVELTDPPPMLVIEVVSLGAESMKNYKRDYELKPREC